MEYSRDSLIAASKFAIERFKALKARNIVITIAFFLGLIGVACFMRLFFEAGSKEIKAVAGVLMAINLPVTSVNWMRVRKEKAHLIVATEALEEYKNGEIDDDQYYTDYVKPELDYLKSNMDKVTSSGF